MERTLLVGLDAACWEYLDPLLQAGQLPTIQKLINAGAWGTLNSTMPPWTPTAWSSLATGKNPGKHGVFDMLRRKPGSYDFEPTNALVRHGTPFWEYLNKAGVRVGLVNIPFTYPPAPIQGFMVCGFGTPESVRDLAWPPDALEWIESRFESYEPIVSTETLRSGKPEEILAIEMKHQSRLIEISAGLTELYQVDVLAINLMLTDHANHKMPEMEQVQAAYCQSDIDLETLIDSFRPDNVMLISDHGSSRLKGDFLFNVWLREHGYCVYLDRTPAQQKEAFTAILKLWAQEHKGWSGYPEKLTRRFIRAVLPRLPQQTQRRFWAGVENAIPFAESHVRLSTSPDYSRSAVFPGSLYSGLLYFNIRDEGPNGIIPAHERRALATKLRDELYEIQEPESGERLFTNIFLADEIYDGPYVHYSPDLIVDAYRLQWNIRTRQPGTYIGERHGRYFVTFEQSRDFGWHSKDGIFAFSGPAFRPGRVDRDRILMDVPATLLHIYNVPIPIDWDGCVMSDLLGSEMSRRPILTQPGDTEMPVIDEDVFSTEEADSMVSHLRALGYLD